ncbi:YdeI/OmpD-associated family protein [Paenibacillus pasadenensis]|uniref:YdeI/OmpD-associated family protein n=1 Tax=Paenibacillus pasadenensis TaxID=217090 RepID=UPI0020405D1D|nr:YdeI/OmpD-associated family protein [Paenibacillus pasadenensis]MCM3749487.1 YdeI/OmpD-associated family protein [Paenibacillus pasadenensis]
MKFQSVVYLSGKTATGIQVPDEIVAALGSGKKPAVHVKIGEYAYRSTIAFMGGQFWIPLSAANREGAGVAAGDQIEVEVEMDTAPREIVAPEDLAAALEGAEEARRYFDGLSYSNKNRIVLSIEGAKTAETRQRRIDKAVQALTEGKLP